MGYDLTLIVGDDVIRDKGEARSAQDGRLPESSVADGGPGNGVMFQFLLAFFDVGIETDGQYLQLSSVFHTVITFTLALRSEDFTASPLMSMVENEGKRSPSFR